MAVDQLAYGVSDTTLSGASPLPHWDRGVSRALTSNHHHTTGRGSSDLAAAGGTQESNKFTYAGADYQLTKDLMVQYYYANLEDYYQQHFAGLIHVLPLGDYGSLKTDLRYFKTTSDGKNSSAAGRAEGYKFAGYSKNGSGEIDNNTWSAAFIYSLGPHAITAGYQQVSDDSNFAQLNQGGLVNKGEGGSSLYLYTDRTVQTFIQAGERTAFAQYAYDFAALGVPGLKASMMYLKGDHILTASGNNASEWERDISLDYVVQSGTFKNVGFGWRNGVSRSEVARDQDQNRLFVSYSIPLMLQPVGASLLAKNANDHAGCLTVRGALRFFASKLAPTRVRCSGAVRAVLT
ncbi:hypothetical protein J2Y83_003023 [Pseudomonas marginalis]|nr:hypothetical protein [Pseudomonas marginalis]MCP1524554.1 hypothetical protein [Pseudomonas marginalis]MDQ0499964.1 hypothetical protein [Pseudomonas marginalis]